MGRSGGRLASDRHIRNVRERVLPNGMVLPFDSEAAEVYGQLEAQHRAAGKRIDDFDLLIGATAIRCDLTLVTRNVRHVARIPALRVLPTPGGGLDADLTHCLLRRGCVLVVWTTTRGGESRTTAWR